MKNFVKGVKNLRLDKRRRRRRVGPQKLLVFPVQANADTSKMSLPGLDLSAPVETVATPTVHELKEQTEWRFEVSFGTKVEVRVWIPSWRALFYSLSVS